mgnify:CR=1 FL=1
MPQIEVMIVDDHMVVRRGLRQLLEMGGDISVVAEASRGLECLQLLERMRPDVIFMDIKMPGVNGIETTRLISEKYPEAKIILLTVYEDADHVVAGLRAGAKGYIVKNADRDEMIKAVHRVMKEEAYLDPSITRALVDLVRDMPGVPREERETLTQRELEILNGLFEGQSDQKISETLFISKHTVRSHMKTLFRKLGVSSRSQAIIKGIQMGIVGGTK